MSSELLIRLLAFPKMRDALNALPPKMLTLCSDVPAEPVDLGDEQVRACRQAACSLLYLRAEWTR